MPDPAHPTEKHRGHLLPTASASIIVTTTADKALADNALLDPDEEREFAEKPRGFFADQFEVSLARDPRQGVDADTADRTEATTMLI